MVGFAETRTSVISDSITEGQQQLHNDSVKRSAFIKMSLKLLDTEINTSDDLNSEDYFDKAYNNAIKSDQLSKFAYRIDNLGVKYRNNGAYKKSLFLHKKGYALSDTLNDLKLKSISCNNIGVVYRRIGDYQQAMTYHIQGLKIAENREDSISMAISINSIGNIHMALGNLDGAMNYFKQSLVLEQQLNNMLGIAINLNNVGNVFKEQKELNKAQEYYTLSLNVNKDIGSEKGIAICYNDLGTISKLKGDYTTALEYYKQAMAINKQLGDRSFLSYSMLRIGEAYLLLQKHDSALHYIEPALEMSKSIGSKNNIMEAYTFLYRINESQGNYKEALNFFLRAHDYHDTILSNNIKSDVAKLRIRYESEKKENQITLLQKNAELSDLKIKRQNFLGLLTLSAFIIALGALTFLSFYLYSKNKRNKILLEKNQLIEQAQKELKEYANKLLIAKQEAEINSKTKSEFLANISHEIRTPLNSVIGFADLIAEQVDGQVELGYLNSIKSSGKSLLTLINDILDLSKIESGRFDIFFETVQLDKVMEDLENVFSLILDEKNLELRMEIHPSVPKSIVFSEIRLRQILFNLVGNAIKFTKKGFIEIGMHASPKTSSYVELKIWVKDTGKGIAPDMQQSIFEPFQQEEKTSNEVGTGLGLTISKRLVEALDGQIELESEENEGSTFTILFDAVKLASGIRTSEENSDDSLSSLEDINTLVFLNNEEDGNSCLGALESLGLQLEVVIADLQQAKVMIGGKQLVIICIPEYREASNALTVLRQHCDPEYIQFLVFSKSTNESQEEYRNVAWKSGFSDASDFVNSILPYTQKLRHLWLFHCMVEERSIISKDDMLVSLLKSIFQTLFTTAQESKILNNIKVFANELSSLGQRHELNGIILFCDELTLKAEQFDTESIDLLMNLFEEAFKGLFTNPTDSKTTP